MAHIVFFHSVLRLRPVEHHLAGAWEEDGHHVMLPDLYDGKLTNNYDEGVRLKGEIGDDAIYAMAAEALEEVVREI